MQKIFLIIFLFTIQSVSAQDTLMLITGRKLVVSSVDLQDNSIAYRTLQTDKSKSNKTKLKSIDPSRVFSILYRDGKEKVIYQPDTLDPLDFKVEEMRNFIIGEMDAGKVYKNNWVKFAGLGIGIGSGYLAIYGLVGPPIYSTIIGSFSPVVEKKLSLKISGNAASELGITPGKYLNEITGINQSPVIKKGQELKISNKKFQFNEDCNLDQAVSLINSGFNCSRVSASNVNGKMRIFKTDSSALIKDPAYREGFEKKVRDYKIRNGMISGLIGFIAGNIAYAILFK